MDGYTAVVNIITLEVSSSCRILKQLMTNRISAGSRIRSYVRSNDACIQLSSYYFSLFATHRLFTAIHTDNQIIATTSLAKCMNIRMAWQGYRTLVDISQTLHGT